MSGIKGMRRYTPEEDKYIRKNYGEIKTREIVEKLNRPDNNSIHRRAGRLGLSYKAARMEGI